MREDPHSHAPATVLQIHVYVHPMHAMEIVPYEYLTINTNSHKYMRAD